MRFRRFMEEIDAYHGSPHKFEVFSNDSSGKENGNAFGWGLYFTDNKNVARHYADKVPMVWKYDGLEVKDIKGDEGAVVAQLLSDMADLDDFDRAYADLKKYLTDDGDPDLLAALSTIKKSKFEFTKPSGNIYRVILHRGKKPGDYRYIDWDKPISQADADMIVDGLHAGVAADEFTDADIRKSRVLDYIITNLKNGSMVYGALRDLMGSEKMASLFLLKCGIDGMKYRDIYTKHEDSMNYVVFDPKAVTIEKEPV